MKKLDLYFAIINNLFNGKDINYDLTNSIIEFVDDFERFGEDERGKYVTCGNCYNNIYYQKKRYNTYRKEEKSYYKASIYVRYKQDYELEILEHIRCYDNGTDIIFPIYEIEKDIVCSIKCKREKEMELIKIYDKNKKKRIIDEKISISILFEDSKKYTLISYMGCERYRIRGDSFQCKNENYRKYLSKNDQTLHKPSEVINKTSLKKKIKENINNAKNILTNVFNGELIIFVKNSKISDNYKTQLCKQVGRKVEIKIVIDKTIKN